MKPDTRLAILGFVFHGPGVRVLGGRTLNARIWRINLWALAATGAAMIGGFAAGGPWGLFWGWFVGHFAWGTYFARALYRGEAVEPLAAKN